MAGPGAANLGSGWLTLAWLVGGLSLVMLWALLAPDRQEHRYAVPLAAGLEYRFNADSPGWARLVVRFPSGFVDAEQGRVRLQRPLYPALAWVAYLVTAPLQPLIPTALAARAEQVVAGANHPEIWGGISGRQLLAGWAALVGVNLLATLAAVWLLAAVARTLLPSAAALVLALLPAFHPGCRDFLLMPAAEWWNLLLPALFLSWLVFESSAPGRGWGLVAALGLGMLVKAVAAVAVPVVLLTARARGWRPALLAGGLLVGPLAAYLLALYGCGLPTANHEVTHYRQIVWMSDAWAAGRAGEIMPRLLGGAVTRAWQTWETSWPILAAAAVLVGWNRARSRRLPGPRSPLAGSRRSALLAGCVAYLGSSYVFWMAVGYHQPRLTLLDVPVWLLLLAALLTPAGERPA